MQRVGLHMSPRKSALRVLFSLYLTGKIAETMWEQMMSIFDTYAANSGEREALALFFTDAFRELGPESTKIPKEDEVQEILSVMRSA